jgi:hypothetical protein
MRMAMAFLMEADFHPEFPPRPGTLIVRRSAVEATHLLLAASARNPSGGDGQKLAAFRKSAGLNEDRV